MPVNNAGGYSGRSVAQPHGGDGQEGFPGFHGMNGTPSPQAPPRPPKTTGSAPTFHANGNAQAK